NARLVELSARVRREVGLGFDAEPYTPRMRQRALRQHPVLADAVIAGNPARAARHAASHFLLTEDALAEVRARLHLRTGENECPSPESTAWPTTWNPGPTRWATSSPRASGCCASTTGGSARVPSPPGPTRAGCSPATRRPWSTTS